MTKTPTPQPKLPEPKLVVPRSEAQARLETHIANGYKIAKRDINSEEDMKKAFADSDKWKDYAIRLLAMLFDNPTLSEAYKLKTHLYHGHNELHFTEAQKALKNQMDDWWIKELESIAESIELFAENTMAIAKHDIATTIKDPRIDALNQIERIAKRFHIIARQLGHRHSDRETLVVKDEYDVQDLFHTLLRLFFDDIRDEEWTPSYAGGAARIDFLLKAEQIVIELKMTRSSLKKKEIGDQLIIDIGRYRATHPDCKMIVAFVYDPDGYINNPRGLENDLSREVEGMQVKVMITPQ